MRAAKSPVGPRYDNTFSLLALLLLLPLAAACCPVVTSFAGSVNSSLYLARLIHTLVLVVATGAPCVFAAVFAVTLGDGGDAVCR